MTPHDPEADAPAGARDHPEDLRRLVVAQAELIAQIQQRLDQLEGERAVPRDPDPTAGASTPTTALDAPTSRRTLMTRGAAAAATAVIGTAAAGLATATPAAAAPATFDGNPAVRADAVPSTGRAVEAYSAGGRYGLETLYSENRGVGGTALAGHAVGQTGESIGVMGYSGSRDPGYGVVGESSQGTGVYGRSNASRPGVVGSSAYGDGVLGSAGLGNGVLGTAWDVGGIGVTGRHDGEDGTAIRGAAEEPGATRGVHAITNSAPGIAVHAEAGSGGTGIVSDTDGTHIRFAGAPAAPPGAGLARVKGELVFDADADLWLCVADGTPGTWRKLAGPATAGAFTVLPSTIRVYDSRPGTQPPGVTKTPLGNFAERTIDAKVGGAVPAGGSAVLVNLTIVNTTGSGYLGLFKNGIPYPGNSTINWNQPNTLLANSAVCALDDQARFAVKANVGFCDFVIDVLGYYR